MEESKECTKCFKSWKPEDEWDFKKDGTVMKLCKTCRKYGTDWFEKNRDKVNQSYTCGCGGTYYKRHYKRHIMGQQHKEWEDKKII